jgi:hypothetical protein
LRKARSRRSPTAVGGSRSARTQPRRAAELLASLDGIDRVSVHDGAVELALASNGSVDRELVTATLRRMLDAGLAVDRVVRVEASLEARFLTITHRLEEDQ